MTSYTKNLEEQNEDLKSRLAIAETKLAEEPSAEYVITHYSIDTRIDGVTKVSLELEGYFQGEEIENLIGHSVYIRKAKLK